MIVNSVTALLDGSKLSNSLRVHLCSTSDDDNLFQSYSVSDWVHIWVVEWWNPRTSAWQHSDVQSWCCAAKNWPLVTMSRQRALSGLLILGLVLQQVLSQLNGSPTSTSHVYDLTTRRQIRLLFTRATSSSCDHAWTSTNDLEVHGPQLYLSDKLAAVTCRNIFLTSRMIFENERKRKRIWYWLFSHSPSNCGVTTVKQLSMMFTTSVGHSQ